MYSFDVYHSAEEEPKDWESSDSRKPLNLQYAPDQSFEIK